MKYLDKLRDYFSGTNEQREALEKAAQLKSQKKLNKADRTLVKDSEVISRRLFVRKGVAGLIGSAIIVGVGAYLVFGNGSHSVDDKDDKKDTPEKDPAIEKMDKMLVRLDEKFHKLKEIIATGKERSGLSDKQIEDLLAPIRAYEENRAMNSNRNFLSLPPDDPHLQNLFGTETGDRNFTFNRYGDTFYFSFLDKAPDRSSKIPEYAMFSPMARVVYLKSDFDPDSWADLLALYHELVHVAQDSGLRQKYGDNDGTLTVKTGRKYIEKRLKSSHKLNSELQAYAFQLELLDMVTYGYCRAMSLAGWDKTKLQWSLPENAKEDPDYARHIKQMFQDPRVKGFRNVMIRYATSFFPEGIKTPDYRKEFIRIVARDYQVELRKDF